jgi:hypothetical protein
VEERGEVSAGKRGEGEKYERAETVKAEDGGRRCGEEWGVREWFGCID